MDKAKRTRAGVVAAFLAGALAFLCLPPPCRGAGAPRDWFLPEEEVHRDGEVTLRDKSGVRSMELYLSSLQRERAALAEADGALGRARVHLRAARARLEMYRELSSRGIYSVKPARDAEEELYEARLELDYAVAAGRDLPRAVELLEGIQGCGAAFAEKLSADRARLTEKMQKALGNTPDRLAGEAKRAARAAKEIRD